MTSQLTRVALVAALAIGGAAFEPVAAAPTATSRPAPGVDASREGSPLYYQGLVYVGTAVGVAALDPRTGAIIIHYRTGSPVLSTPAVMRAFDPQPDPPGRLIVASSDGTLSAFELTTGQRLWQVNLGAEPTSALVVGGVTIHALHPPRDVVLVGAGDTVTAFDANGTEVWATRLEGGDVSKGGAVMIDQTNEIVAASTDELLSALDASTGRVLWVSAVTS